jgi:hypothetical protein
MSRRRDQGDSEGKQPPMTAVPGTREAIERAWFTAVMSGADPQRIAQLERMLRPASNDPFEAAVLSPDGPPKAT